ncbi:MAG: peroxiredoxin [Acidimicrobiales bacterium]
MAKVAVGAYAPEFSLVDESGTTRSLNEFLARGPLVLFFYPAAMTAGCTAECRHFRDVGPEFEALGVQRAGISRDSVERQLEFSQRNAFDYPLLSDPDGVVADAYGTRRNSAIVPTRRWTFVVDIDRRVLGVIKSETRMRSHADRALEVLRARTR